MSAIRTARGFTGRDKIVKFEGCYHGHSDGLLVKAGSGLLTFGEPDSGGVPASVAAHTLTLEYNNSQALEDLFAQVGDEIACVIIEPVVGNMNLIVPHQAFLQTLRALCTKHGAVLIFDEVMTGFRVALGGAQAYYDVKPDLTTLGKIIGGGMPVGAFGGKKAIMQHIAPLGPVYQAGTLSGNPIAMAAGLAALTEISKPGVYESLTAKTKQLLEGLKTAAAKHGVPLCVNQVGGMFGLFFTSATTVSSYAQATQCNIEAFKKFFHLMLAEGIYLAPSAYEAGFLSLAHSDADLAATIAAADRAFAQL